MTLNITKTFVKYTQLTVGTMIYRKIAGENWSGTRQDDVVVLWLRDYPLYRDGFFTSPP